MNLWKTAVIMFADKANVELGTAAVDEEPRSIWYFEPADEGAVSAKPTNGMLCRIRARHSGQYVRAVNDTMRVGDGLQQTYSSFSQAEEFLLTKAENTNGTDWYFIRSVSDPEKYLDVCSKGTDGYDRPTLQAKSGADSQKFCFMIGIDQSEEMLCVVRDKAEQLGLSGGLLLLRQDARSGRHSGPASGRAWPSTRCRAWPGNR